jgi:hypothetical protein
LYAIGDLHISNSIWERLKGAHGDSAFMLAEIKGLLTGDDDLVLVGDIFDASEPGPTLGRMFREWAEDVSAAGNRIWVLQGNHDKRVVPWPLALSSCVTYIGDGTPVTIAGVPVRALDYQPRDLLARKLAEMGTEPLPEILFLHQSAKQYLDVGDWNLDLEWVPEGIPLVVMGDIHEPWGCPVRPGQYACYTGAGHTRSITEARHGKSVLGITSDGHEHDIQRFPIRSRAIRAASLVAATLERTREEVRAWVRELMAGNGLETAPVGMLPPILHLTYTDDVPSAPDLIQEAITDLGTKMFILAHPVSTRTQNVLRMDPAAAAQGIPTIPALLDASGLAKRPEVRDLTLDLIRPGKASEIRDRIALRRGEFFKAYDAKAPA